MRRGNDFGRRRLVYREYPGSDRYVFAMSARFSMEWVYMRSCTLNVLTYKLV